MQRSVHSLSFALLLLCNSFAYAGDSKTIKDTDTNINSCQQHSTGEWIDRFQAATHTNLCSTARWVDHLFGKDQSFDASSFKGQLIFRLIERKDESIDPKLRLRVKADLPNMSKRFKAFAGRFGDQDDLRDNPTDAEKLLAKDSDDDASWLIGFGYKRFPNRGLSFSAGGKFNSGFQPYAKVSHRYTTSLNRPYYIAFNQLAYVRKDEGYGLFSSFDYNYKLNNENILRWGAGLRYKEEDELAELLSSITWFHHISDKRGLTVRGFYKAIEDSPVGIPEYGIGFSYRKPLHREWLQLKMDIENRWSKYDVSDDWEPSHKLTMQLEMLFGNHK